MPRRVQGLILKLRKHGLYHVWEMENVKKTLETMALWVQDGGCKDSSVLHGLPPSTAASICEGDFDRHVPGGGDRPWASMF